MKELGLLELLRYALSGGIGISVLLLTYPAAACSIREMDATKETTLVLGSVLLLGALIYNVHRALVYPVLLWAIGSRVTDWDTLEADRWRWQHPEEKRKRWDEWGAQTHSLYCATWSIIGALIVGRCFWQPRNCRTPLFFLVFSSVTLAAAVTSNCRLMHSIVVEKKHCPDPREPKTPPTA
jgi:hypothetical protein